MAPSPPPPSPTPSSTSPSSPTPTPSSLTKRYAGVPAWAWVGLGVVAFVLVWKRTKKTTTTSASTSTTPTVVTTSGTTGGVLAKLQTLAQGQSNITASLRNLTQRLGVPTSTTAPIPSTPATSAKTPTSQRTVPGLGTFTIVPTGSTYPSTFTLHGIGESLGNYQVGSVRAPTGAIYETNPTYATAVAAQKAGAGEYWLTPKGAFVKVSTVVTFEKKYPGTTTYEKAP